MNKKLVGLILFLLLFLLVSTAANCAVIYVKPDGKDINNGRSWDGAKKTVQAGIRAALTGDEIWVAAGTYTERITLKKETSLYGGFKGSETKRDERDWRANKTVIDAQKRGRVVTSPTGALESTRIDGFILQNGKADYGGGMHCKQSSPTIANNVIKLSSAIYGAGIYLENSAPIIANNSIYENDADAGGGIHCGSASPVIIENIIQNNSAVQGGGISCWEGGNPVIANNIITGNSVGAYGGGISCMDSSPSVINNTIVSNYADNGGGIYGDELSAAGIYNNIIAFGSSGIQMLYDMPKVDYNCVYNPEGTNYIDMKPKKNEISKDPLFVDRKNGDFRLKPGSPCIDAGWEKAPDIPEKDKKGNSRVANKKVDIGAYEFQEDLE